MTNNNVVLSTTNGTARVEKDYELSEHKKINTDRRSICGLTLILYWFQAMYEEWLLIFDFCDPVVHFSVKSCQFSLKSIFCFPIIQSNTFLATHPTTSLCIGGFNLHNRMVNT
jgi:hypothetical protein